MVNKFFLYFTAITFITIASITFFFSKEENRNEIILGASLPLTGINKELGQEVAEGANTYFSHINARGGIKGKNINFIYYDDKYEPQNTLKNIKTLIDKDKVFALFGFVGTPTTKKVLPIILDENIPFIAPYTGALFLRDLDHKNIINFRSSYKDEVENMVDYLYKERNIRKFSIFYQNDDYGEEGYIAMVKALKQKDLKLVSEGTYKRNTLSVRHALHEIKLSKPEAIIIVGAYKPSARFIKKARECCFEDTLFVPISFVNANALLEELQKDATNIIFSQTVPSYDDETLMVSVQYKKLLKFYYPKSKPSFASFESFLAAKIVVNALQNIDGALSHKKFLNNITNTSTDILDGILIEHKNSQLLNSVYLSIYTDGKFMPIERRK